MQNRTGWCDSSTGFHFPGIGVERHTPLAVRKDLPNRNRGRNTLMPVHFPSESGLPAEASHGRRCWRTATMPCAGFGALGIFFTRRECRCRSGHHRHGCGGSTPPSRRVLADGHQGLQALQRCSGLLNRRARGSTVATHHFGGGTWTEKFMRSLACPARRIKLLPSASSSVSNAPVAQCIERRASNAEVAGESPAGSTNLRACG